jgi:hypothetical protein
MRARVKRNGGRVPAIIVRIYDMHRVNERRGVGVEVMNVIVYLPENRTYASMKRRVTLYHDDSGKETAIVFTGKQIALDDKRPLRLCRRLALVRESLVGYVRRLAAAA